MNLQDNYCEPVPTAPRLQLELLEHTDVTYTRQDRHRVVRAGGRVRVLPGLVRHVRELVTIGQDGHRFRDETTTHKTCCPLIGATMADAYALEDAVAARHELEREAFALKITKAMRSAAMFFALVFAMLGATACPQHVDVCVVQEDCDAFGGNACIDGACEVYQPQHCSRASATMGCDPTSELDLCYRELATCTRYCTADVDCMAVQPWTCDELRGVCVQPCADAAGCSNEQACIAGACGFGGEP